MKNQLDLTIVLKKCPKGIKLYSPALGECAFERVRDNSNYPIEVSYKISNNDIRSDYFTKDGYILLNKSDAECMLFPSKDQRDWSEWQRPFVDGDIVHGNNEYCSYICIYKSDRDDESFNHYASLDSYGRLDVNEYSDKKNLRFATEDEIAKLFKSLEINGCQWDAKTKTLNMKNPIDWSMIHRPFVDGDIVTNKNTGGTWIGIYHEDYSNKAFSSYCYLRRDGVFCATQDTGHTYYETRLATEEEKNKLLEVIKKNGYRWNSTTKTLEKLDDMEDKGNLSDGYHTFNELYKYRLLYNAGMFNEFAKQGLYDVHKSKKHSDGTIPFNDENWFIVQVELPTGQISNHYEMKDWDLFKIPEKERANPYDGHTPKDVVERLNNFLTLEQMPQFKIGDKIKLKGGDELGIITQITDSYFTVNCNNHTHYWSIKKQDNWELVSDEIKSESNVGDKLMHNDDKTVTAINDSYGMRDGHLFYKEPSQSELDPNKFYSKLKIITNVLDKSFDKHHLKIETLTTVYGFLVYWSEKREGNIMVITFDNFEEYLDKMFGQTIEDFGFDLENLKVGGSYKDKDDVYYIRIW